MDTYLLAISLTRVRAITPLQRVQRRARVRRDARSCGHADDFGLTRVDLPNQGMTTSSFEERVRAAPA